MGGVAAGELSAEDELSCEAVEEEGRIGWGALLVVDGGMVSQLTRVIKWNKNKSRAREQVTNEEEKQTTR